MKNGQNTTKRKDLDRYNIHPFQEVMATESKCNETISTKSSKYTHVGNYVGLLK